MSSPGQDEPVEVEWQFDAIDLRPVERWLASSSAADAGAELLISGRATRRLVDSYVDTEDWRLARSGFVLRARRRGRGSEATLKDLVPANGGLRRRLEMTEALPPEADSRGIAALDPLGPLGRRVHALAGTRPLVQVMEVRTRRRPFDLLLDGEAVAEIALDETTIDLGPGQSPLRLWRVEVEVSPSRAGELAPVVERLRLQCGLQAATFSKFEAGLLAAGVELPRAPDLGTSRIGEQPTLGEVAFAALRKDFGAMLAHEPGTRIGEDPEELHDMRVATRHLRAALAQFAPALPVRAAHWRAELGWLAGVLGDARDLDVQLEQLAEWSTEAGEPDRAALAELGSELAAEREAARAVLLAALDGPRYGRLVTGFTELARRGPSSRIRAAREGATLVLPESIGSLHASARKASRRAARSRQADDFHRLRIRCKRLRYALEFAADVYPGATVAYRKQLTGLQDVLGKLQDAQVASERLRGLATGAGGEASRLPSSTIFVMGALAQRYRQHADALLQQLPGRVRLLAGPEWRRLVETMEGRRPDTRAGTASAGAERESGSSLAEPATSEPDPVGQLTPAPPSPQ